MQADMSGKFINNLNFKNCLTISLFRAPIDNGNIVNFSFPETMPPGSGIFSYADISGEKEIDISGYKIPLLCNTDINYRGEPLFIIAAENKNDIKTIFENIDIEYILKPPLVFGSKFENSQIVKEKEYIYKYEDALPEKTKTTVIESETSGNLYSPEYNEPCGAAVIRENDNYIVYADTQWPFHVRNSVASVLKIPVEKVIVKSAKMGSPLEGHLWFPSFLAAYAAIAVQKTGRPAKLILNKEENNLYIPKQHPFRIKYKSRFNKENILISSEVEINIDTGAYPVFSDELFENALLGAMGAYFCPEIKIKERIIKTSAPPMSAITSMNFSQIFIAAENHAYKIVSEKKISPHIWKKENLLQKNRPLANMKNIDSGNAGAGVLDKVTEISDFKRKYSAYELSKQNKSIGKTDKYYTRGIGIALGFFTNNLNTLSKDSRFSNRLLLDSNGNLTIFTSTVPQNFTAYQLWKDIAAKITGIEKENIFIAPHDTDINEESIPNIEYGITQLIFKNCQALQKLRFRNPLPLTISSKNILRTRKNFLTWGAAAVEVSIDMSIYEVSIKGIWADFDCGTILSKEIAKKNFTAGIIKSLRWATGTNENNYGTGSWKFADIPMTINFENHENRKNILSGGDLTMALIPAAYSNAVSQAIGKNIFSFPINSESIYRTMEVK